MAFRDLLRSFLAPTSADRRVVGQPTSSNRASSMHLFWQMPDVDLMAVEATIEITAAPPEHRLCFWALQVGFSDGTDRLGAGHLGLQAHPDYPDRGAVNWGGYRTGGGELPGTPLGNPSSLGNPNTCDYSWNVGRSYRYAVSPSPDRGWRGSVTDMDSGHTFVVRDLLAGGDRLISPMVWTESFAHCDDASSSVRWSNLRGLTMEGDLVTPTAVRVNFQTEADGGCSNTDITKQGNHLIQTTNTARTISSGSLISLDPA